MSPPGGILCYASTEASSYTPPSLPSIPSNGEWSRDRACSRVPCRRRSRWSNTIQASFRRFSSASFRAISTALVAANFELVDVPTGQRFIRPGGLHQWLGNFITAGPDAQTELIRVIISGDWTTIEHTGPVRSPAGVIEATGQRVESPKPNQCSPERSGARMPITS